MALDLNTVGKSTTYLLKSLRLLISSGFDNSIPRPSIICNIFSFKCLRWLSVGFIPELTVISISSEKRYDGTLQSLADKSHRPHHHPNQHTPEELKLISDMRKKNKNTGLVVFWVKLRQRGYTRSITGLYRILLKTGQTTVKLPNPKYIPKPYEQMMFPGQRVQIDVKFVPASCLVGEAKEEKYYQFTTIDEYSRYRYLEDFNDNSSYSASEFMKHLVKKFPFPILCVQTDNGSEFTNRFFGSGRTTMFQETLKSFGIEHKLIKPFTPRHNGKVERSHRKDNEYFYASHKFYSFEDFCNQLKMHNYKYNRFPMRPLCWHSPQDYVSAFVQDGEILFKCVTHH